MTTHSRGRAHGFCRLARSPRHPGDQGKPYRVGGGELNIGHFKDEDTKAARMFPDTLLQGAGLGEASVPQRCPRAPPSSVTAGVLLGFWNNFSYC